MLYRYSSELEEGHHHNGTADYSFSLLCMGALILLLNKPLGSTPFLFEPLFIAIIYQWVRSQPCSRSDQASTLARHKQTRRSRSICSVSFLCKSATARQASLMVPQRRHLFPLGHDPFDAAARRNRAGYRVVDRDRGIPRLVLPNARIPRE
jgi:hypothetical protein